MRGENTGDVLKLLGKARDRDVNITPVRRGAVESSRKVPEGHMWNVTY